MADTDEMKKPGRRYSMIDLCAGEARKVTRYDNALAPAHETRFIEEDEGGRPQISIRIKCRPQNVAHGGWRRTEVRFDGSVCGERRHLGALGPVAKSAAPADIWVRSHISRR